MRWQSDHIYDLPFRCEVISDTTQATSSSFRFHIVWKLNFQLVFSSCLSTQERRTHFLMGNFFVRRGWDLRQETAARRSCVFFQNDTHNLGVTLMTLVSHIPWKISHFFAKNLMPSYWHFACYYFAFICNFLSSQGSCLTSFVWGERC